jgi:hypothetical protein
MFVEHFIKEEFNGIFSLIDVQVTRDLLVKQVSREEIRLERKVTRVMPVALVATESLDHQEIKVVFIIKLIFRFANALD